LATLYESPTIVKLTDLISDKETQAQQWSSLVPIQPGSLKPPVFCIHGAGGNVLIYRDLARHLGADQPVYGLQSQGLNGKQPFLTSIEDMASHYLAEIQAVQPEGPYMVGGYCMGGTVAFEIAQQLVAQGQQVALLFMLETYVWKYLKYETWFDKAYYEFEKIGFHWRNFMMLPNNEKMTFIQEKFKVAQSRRHIWFGMLATKMRQMLRMGGEQGTSLSDLWENNDNAAIAYAPKVFPGKITQFRPAKDYSRYDNPNFGWEKHAADGVEIHKLPVFPAGMIVEPFVPMLAASLKDCMQKAKKTLSNA
jgi:thioesterase domain-containing protein